MHVSTVQVCEMCHAYMRQPMGKEFPKKTGFHTFYREKCISCRKWSINGLSHEISALSHIIVRVENAVQHFVSKTA